MTTDTLLINLYGGPGSGKSTTAARVFSVLKMTGRNAELVTEHAKDLTWENHEEKLRFQPAIMGEQMWRLERLRGKVDVIVTDTPILLSCIYGKGMTGHLPWCEYVQEYAASWRQINFQLQRGRRAFNPAGRSQTEAQAIHLDTSIASLLHACNVATHDIVCGDAGTIVRMIREELHPNRGEDVHVRGQASDIGGSIVPEVVAEDAFRLYGLERDHCAD